ESNLYNYEDEILSISRLMDKLRKDITSIRMVHVENLFNTAIRTANTAANIEGKSVNILYSGEKIAIDQSIFDGLKEAFLHLVRNAVSHGIESPEQRKLVGKNPEGTLVFRALREGNQVIFEIEDDGAGIDIEKVRNKAVDKGLLDRYEADNMRVDKLFDLLFLPGFSTKDSVGELSGRGVGLDVVKENIEKIGGYVKIYSEYGKGTKVILNINMKELIAEYLLVRENGQEFSIPLLNIVTIFYLDTKKLQKRSDGYKYDFRGELLDIYDLGVLLGQVKLGYLDSYKSCIVLSSKGKKYIIVIDEVLDRMVTITKPLPKSISHFNHFSGATIDANGNVALILDPMYLIKDTLIHNISLTIDKKDEKLKKIDYIPNSILIVDDSLSVRKYLGKLLTSYGFNYVEATDGIAAIDNLRSRKFDLIITDLEMPLMNGYELINHIRGEMLDHETPIFVLTSRATDKHRNKAMELGANDFLMKPFDEDEVISKIKEVISARVNFSK
ncbi:MAG: response regulator, partial [Deferribacterales bacterium]